MQIAALAPLSAAGESVKVVTAGSSSNDWQLRMEYVAYIEGDGDASFGLSSTLPAGSQTIHLNFEVQLELPDNLPSSRTLVAHIGLGQDADYWATDGNDVFFGIGLDPKDAGVGVRFNGADRVPFTSFGTELSRAAARVSLEITTPAGFRTGAAPAELSYTYTVKVDFDEDGQADFTSTGSYMDTKWAIQLHFGLERWWVGAGSTASQTPLRASLNTDNVVPTLRTATVNGATLVLTYDEALDTTSMPAEGDFIVEVDDTQVNLANTNPVAVSGMTVTLTLQTAVTNNRQTVTLDYTAGTNPIQDLAGNDASNLTDQAVTNSTADATGPMLPTSTTSPRSRSPPRGKA